MGTLILANAAVTPEGAILLVLFFASCIAASIWSRWGYNPNMQHFCVGGTLEYMDGSTLLNDKKARHAAYRDAYGPLLKD